MIEEREFDRVFRLYYEQLYYFAQQYVADAEECHDIVSAAYEDVWREAVRIELKTVRLYLYTNVRNKCIDHLRRESRRRSYVEYAQLMSQTSLEEGHAMEREENERLVAAVLSRLKSPTREILMACYVDEKKYSQVAEEMGISISTVKKHMVRALKFIRDVKKQRKA